MEIISELSGTVKLQAMESDSQPKRVVETPAPPPKLTLIHLLLCATKAHSLNPYCGSL